MICLLLLAFALVKTGNAEIKGYNLIFEWNELCEQSCDSDGTHCEQVFEETVEICAEICTDNPLCSSFQLSPRFLSGYCIWFEYVASKTDSNDLCHANQTTYVTTKNKTSIPNVVVSIPPATIQPVVSPGIELNRSLVSENPDTVEPEQKLLVKGFTIEHDWNEICHKSCSSGGVHCMGEVVADIVTCADACSAEKQCLGFQVSEMKCILFYYQMNTKHELLECDKDGETFVKITKIITNPKLLEEENSNQSSTVCSYLVYIIPAVVIGLILSGIVAYCSLRKLGDVVPEKEISLFNEEGPAPVVSASETVEVVPCLSADVELFC